MKRNGMIGLIALLALVLAVGCAQNNTKEDTAKPAENAVTLEMYVMSQCPYGVQVQKGIAPVMEKMGEYVDLKMDYIATETAPGQFKALHGQPEVDGNIVQLCAKDIAPDKYMDFILCQAENPRAIPGNWEECATKTQLDSAKLKACKEGEQGKKLLSESAKRAEARKATGSPTIYLAGEKYSGGRSPEDFMRAICAAIQGEKPKACSEIPEPPKVNLVILNDKRCDSCGEMADRIKGQLKGMMPGLTTKEVDYMTDEGKKLFAETKVDKLPAFLFDESIAKDEEGSKRLSRWLVAAGQYKNLRVGAKHDPTAEICDNKVDDTGNGKVDCDDPTCTGDLLCREEIPKRLDVFVMSQCPYGVRALDAMEEVLKNFGDQIEFNVNFIATKEGDGFKALHGQPEVDENIRELCAIKHYPKDYKYMDYILCRNKNIRSNEWQSCTGDNGIKTAVIEKCFNGPEGKQLLEENIKIANSIGVSASPTWMANNKHKFSGIDAETIKNNLCKYNKDLKNCDKKLSGQTQGAAPAGSCN